jgi:RNA polymerase sigma factor (sigma-70 family)
MCGETSPAPRKVVFVQATLASVRSALMAALEAPEARDRDLLARVLERDEDAFRGLFHRYASSAKALAQRVVRQPHLAEEIVQEAFMAVWKDPAGYDGERGSVRGWLMGMVHHRAVDLVRREEAHRRRAEAAIPHAVEEQGDHADDVVRTMAEPGERQAVRAALDDLPTEQREVLEMMYFDGLSQSQIAGTTGIPLGTVKSRTLLGMRRMRHALTEVER